MKILKSCGSRSFGGIEIYILRTIQNLLKLNNEVALICPANSTIQKKANELSIKTYPLLDHGLSRIYSIIKLKQHLHNNNYDIIHTHLSNDLWTIVPALNLSKSKSRLILSKCMESGINKKDIFHKYLYNKVDKIVAVSEFLKQNLLETCPVSEAKIIVIPDAVSVNDLNPDNYNRAKIRSKLGFSDEETVIGLIGRMTPGKGHEIFFECVKLISQAMNNIKFIVVGAASYGESAYEKKLMNIVEKLNIKSKIIFTGYRENIPDYLAAIDILAFPSHRESFGGTVLEAMAMKVPVVAFASGGVKEIIIDNYTGILVPSFSVKDFSNALITLINNKELRYNFGRNARDVVKNKFDLNSNMLIFSELYNSILSEKKP